MFSDADIFLPINQKSFNVLFVHCRIPLDVETKSRTLKIAKKKKRLKAL
jgi:hypothetical protein